MHDLQQIMFTERLFENEVQFALVVSRANETQTTSWLLMEPSLSQLAKR